MNDILVSRRGFIKGTGMAVMAAACSGMLTGCSGGSSGDSFVESEEVTLGNFKVKITNVRTRKVINDPNTNNEKTVYYIIPDIKLTYIGTGFNGQSFKDSFSATLNGTDLKLENNDQIFAIDAKVVNYTRTYSPEFSTNVKNIDVENAADAFEYNTSSIDLTIKFGQDTAVYTLTYGSPKFSAKLKEVNRS